jgi:hypothetical protein
MDVESAGLLELVTHVQALLERGLSETRSLRPFVGYLEQPEDNSQGFLDLKPRRLTRADDPYGEFLAEWRSRGTITRLAEHSAACPLCIFHSKKLRGTIP